MFFFNSLSGSGSNNWRGLLELGLISSGLSFRRLPLGTTFKTGIFVGFSSTMLEFRRQVTGRFVISHSYAFLRAPAKPAMLRRTGSRTEFHWPASVRASRQSA